MKYFIDSKLTTYNMAASWVTIYEVVAARRRQVVCETKSKRHAIMICNALNKQEP